MDFINLSNNKKTLRNNLQNLKHDKIIFEKSLDFSCFAPRNSELEDQYFCTACPQLACISLCFIMFHYVLPIKLEINFIIICQVF